MRIIPPGYIEKLRRMRYLNRGIVIAADLLLSVAGTLLSYVFILTLFNEWQLDRNILTMLISSAFVSIVLFSLSGLYKVIIRHFALSGLLAIFGIQTLKNIVLVFIAIALTGKAGNRIFYCAVMDILLSTFLMAGVRAFIVSLYYAVVKTGDTPVRCAFMYGTQGNSPILAAQINKDFASPYRIKGFLTTDKKEDGITIAGEKVCYIGGSGANLPDIFRKNAIRCVIFSSAGQVSKEREHLVQFCINRHIPMLIAGELRKMGETVSSGHSINPVQIEDLLGREEIKIDTAGIAGQLSRKVILVTGAAGSIGREIVLQLARFDVKRLVLLDNAETPLHDLRLEMNGRYPHVDTVFRLGDIRSVDTVAAILAGYSPDLVFHAAAYKHVPMIEDNPCEAVLANIWGTLNLARQARKYGVGKFIMISTDKAVNPTNVMGASKRIAEICVQRLGAKPGTRFITTRFGNVLGSNGSVIPLFKKQIAAGGPVTVTHPDIVRYFMTIPEACRLVLQAAALGQGGEIFVFDMGGQVRIADLAAKMISLSGLEPGKDIAIEYTGLRPGEKLYEELLTDEEKTGATSHRKIRIAPSQAMQAPHFEEDIKTLILSARHLEVEKTVRIMKQLLPEFISNNSEFGKYDRNTTSPVGDKPSPVADTFAG